ncbi:bifunctional folylpolyglutamate synthase/dihydrofolate synthase [Flagellimonas zhangzhouensis]|uniref:Dihydrofolate synthase/folylpolyglutamate synthase n=1 Tax=Flagellimonas zhangzhouensis TaxID=1073328 RepID=A0A1H2Q1T8_9FLAO|nr:folylpolyglutamate synthase/dihydrofolate synthase family protein [Allomuricauda zhangzhouensis]SDQ46829.1 dihydrofolate synthase / folylpolyglutamate synthase [Allomuricauda zhangzhouensis]SDW01105.1 dihydrofolate synthase / folylpolyglutamate synthase [Allomuricauda zhangzhouensis]
MTYKETLDWMFVQLPMYQQKGAVAMNAKLDNILHFASVLGNPEKKFKSIHVAGTNGKGSSSHMLASILQETGHKVGLYTSPHLKDFRERIKINGQVVGEEFVVDFIAQHKPFLEYHKLSFFEMTVGMAFQYFAQEEVDVAIIEVGLGGRLDSTNIITPEVSLITNIGLDHTQFLGDTLEKIALEKAGIIKPKVPVVISETQPETKMIFNLIAHQLKSDIVFADEHLAEGFKTDLLGDYQQKNMNGVVATIQQLKGFAISEKAINDGLKKVVANTGLLGRWQILQKSPLVVCDTAHNKEGLQLVLQQVAKQSYDRLHIVLGFVNDKDVKSVLGLFPKEASYYFVRPAIPRGMDVNTLCELAKEQGLVGEKYGSVQKGFAAALENAQSTDMVYVGGSTFVVAEVV